MFKPNSIFAFLMMLLLPSILMADSLRVFPLSADTWARPRSGESLVQMESVRLAVEYWGRLDRAKIKLSYPGEDSGELWASELRDWLITLGVPGDVIVLSPGLQSMGELRLLVGFPEDVNL